MIAPRYALLTDGLARKMKADVLNRIIEEAIGIDLHPAEYRTKNIDERIKSLLLAKQSYWRRAQAAPRITSLAHPDILHASEINAWLRSLPEQEHQ